MARSVSMLDMPIPGAWNGSNPNTPGPITEDVKALQETLKTLPGTIQQYIPNKSGEGTTTGNNAEGAGLVGRAAAMLPASVVNQAAAVLPASIAPTRVPEPSAITTKEPNAPLPPLPPSGDATTRVPEPSAITTKEPNTPLPPLPPSGDATPLAPSSSIAASTLSPDEDVQKAYKNAPNKGDFHVQIEHNSPTASNKDLDATNSRLGMQPKMDGAPSEHTSTRAMGGDTPMTSMESGSILNKGAAPAPVVSKLSEDFTPIEIPETPNAGLNEQQPVPSSPKSKFATRKLKKHSGKHSRDASLDADNSLPAINTNTNHSGGSGSSMGTPNPSPTKVGFKDKVRGEIKIVHGMVKRDENMIQTGIKMKKGTT
jgi:hypothetical protein